MKTHYGFVFVVFGVCIQAKPYSQRQGSQTDPGLDLGFLPGIKRSESNLLKRLAPDHSPVGFLPSSSQTRFSTYWSPPVQPRKAGSSHPHIGFLPSETYKSGNYIFPNGKRTFGSATGEDEVLPEGDLSLNQPSFDKKRAVEEFADIGFLPPEFDSQTSAHTFPIFKRLAPGFDYGFLPYENEGFGKRLWPMHDFGFLPVEMNSYNDYQGLSLKKRSFLPPEMGTYADHHGLDYKKRSYGFLPPESNTYDDYRDLFYKKRAATPYSADYIGVFPRTRRSFLPLEFGSYYNHNGHDLLRKRALPWSTVGFLPAETNAYYGPSSRVFWRRFKAAESCALNVNAWGEVCCDVTAYGLSGCTCHGYYFC